jgi:hypothetical protein
MAHVCPAAERGLREPLSPSRASPFGRQRNYPSEDETGQSCHMQRTITLLHSDSLYHQSNTRSDHRFDRYRTHWHQIDESTFTAANAASVLARRDVRTPSPCLASRTRTRAAARRVPRREHTRAGRFVVGVAGGARHRRRRRDEAAVARMFVPSTIFSGAECGPAPPDAATHGRLARRDPSCASAPRP